MRKMTCFLYFAFFSCCVMAQSDAFVLSGKVVDGLSKLPLLGASVFAQSTTIGTATDPQGQFTLRLLNGGYDLIVTFTGYQTLIRRISTADAQDKNLVIEIIKKEKELQDVVITSSNEIKDGLIKYGDFFIDNFIGKTTNSKQCIIKNKEVLKFFFSKKKNRLKVIASEPLEIENAALGYKIKYTLDSFTHEYGTQLSTYSGYPLFEDMHPADDIQKTGWYTSRLKAYYGSMLHFMRSVHNKTIKEQGFEIQFVTNTNDKEVAIPIKDTYGALNYSLTDSTKQVEIMLNQPNLAVLYTKQAPDPLYIIQSNDLQRNFQLSVISIAANQSIDIEQNGYFFDQNDIVITGYWSWQKVADALPYDFRP